MIPMVMPDDQKLFLDFAKGELRFQIFKKLGVRFNELNGFKET